MKERTNKKGMQVVYLVVKNTRKSIYDYYDELNEFVETSLIGCFDSFERAKKASLKLKKELNEEFVITPITLNGKISVQEFGSLKTEE